jgi:hypothetical protein
MRYTSSDESDSGGINMPYCNKCGFRVHEEMQFCPNCGAPLKVQRSVQEKAAPSAESGTMLVLIRMTPFTNGISIGLGVATLLGSLAIAFFLNATYWRLRDALIASGLEPQHINSSLSGTGVLIGGAAAFTIIGLYAILLGVLSQLNPTVRAALNSKNMRVRWGNGFFSGALVFAVSSVQNLVWNIYSPYSFGVWFSVILGIGSIFLILIGLFLVTTARDK